MVETALITGGSSGIGFELAKLFAKDGFRLVIIARDRKKLLDAKQAIEEKYKVNVIAIVQDLSSPEVSRMIFDELQKKGVEVDVLVNNAAVGEYGHFMDSGWESTHRMIQLNITALTDMTKLFMKGMLDRGHGKILNVASTAAFQAGPYMAVYFATKAYVLSFTEALAEEVRKTGVTVTALCPGATHTNFQAAAAMTESGVIKGKKLPSAEEVALFGYRALKDKKKVAVHGGKNSFLIFLQRIVPRSFTRVITRRLMKPKK